MKTQIQIIEEKSYREVVETNDYTGMPYFVREFDPEIFVRLIIEHANECISNVIREESSNPLYYDTDRVKQKIEEYFGIE